MAYIVKKLAYPAKLPALAGAFSPDAIPAPFDALNEAPINQNPWKDMNSTHFPAFARVGWNENGLYVLMYALESPVASQETRIGGETYRDSCMEFFVMPFPEADKRYINVEINSAGVPHVGVGEGRYDRSVFQQAVPGMPVITSVAEGACWAAMYIIPASLLASVYGQTPASGSAMRANFYKCAGIIHPHFAVWNPIVSPKPDFHRPECFGELILE